MIVVIVYGAINNKPTISVDMLAPRSYMEIANMFGVICFSMGVAFVGLSSQVRFLTSLHTQRSMENPSRFKSALIVSLIVPSVIYILFAFGGVVFYYKSGIQDIILANIPANSLWYQISAIGLSLVCFLSYPIAVYPALIACEAWIQERGRESDV